MSFNQLINQAVNHFDEYGFASNQDLENWRYQLRHAAYEESEKIQSSQDFERYLRSIYQKQVETGAILRRHDIERWQLHKVKPKLRNELDRRILAGANLIKLNKEEMILRTLRRFEGWVTSLPQMGEVDKVKAKGDIKSALSDLKFTERRVMIDQGHKFIASLNEIIATDNNAIGAVWQSHWRAVGYKYRPDHKERDGKFYVIRDNWAMQKGLMKLGGLQYTDDITAPAQEVYCQCFYKFVYSLRKIPDECLTEKGKKELATLS